MNYGGTVKRSDDEEIKWETNVPSFLFIMLIYGDKYYEGYAINNRGILNYTGERNEAVPNRYTYVIGYPFTPPQWQKHLLICI